MACRSCDLKRIYRLFEEKKRREAEEAKALATQSRQELIDAMEKELVVEGLLKSAGFEDAVLTTTSENVNVIVKASELSAGELAKIGKIVQEQTGKSLDNIKIIPAA